jgi:DNA-binding NarL/FixJ family response regulator
MLIVEDQEPMRAALREFLQSAYPASTILEAADGAGALERCRSHRPRVVLLDVELPDANGIELIARIKALLPGVAVIMVSQHAGRIYSERARAAGAVAYVAKDAIRRELLPAIAAALANSRLPSVSREAGK